MVVGLQQLVVVFRSFGPTLRHLCRTEEVQLPCLAQLIESSLRLRRVWRRPPTSQPARSSAVQSGPPIPRLPLCGLWWPGIDSVPPARGAADAWRSALLVRDSVGPRPDQPGDFPFELSLVPNTAAYICRVGLAEPPA